MQDDTYYVDLSEYVQHLRLIHFTIIVTCFGFVAAATMNTSSNTERAYAETLAISRVAPTINDEWFRALIATSLRERDVELPIIGKRAITLPTSQGTDIRVVMHFPEAQWLAYTVSQDIPVTTGMVAQSPSGRITLSPVLLRSPSDMNSFEALWNQFAGRIDVYAVQDIAKNARVTLTEYDQKRFDNQIVPLSTDTDSLAPPLNLQFIPVSDPHGSPFVFRAETHVELERTGGSDLIITVQPRLQHLQLSIQPEISRAGRREWERGEFDYSFPELRGLSHTHRRLLLSDLVSVLDAERKHSGEQFEVLGTRMPVRVINRVGVFVLAVLQLYFVLHLRYLNETLRTCGRYRLAVAWIGVYSDTYARAITSLSALAAPGTACYLLWLNIEEYGVARLSTVVLAVMMMTALLTGAAAVRELYRLRGAFLKPS